jgi:hypothetical protein
MQWQPTPAWKISLCTAQALNGSDDGIVGVARRLSEKLV